MRRRPDPSGRARRVGRESQKSVRRRTRGASQTAVMLRTAAAPHPGSARSRATKASLRRALLELLGEVEARVGLRAVRALAGRYARAMLSRRHGLQRVACLSRGALLRLCPALRGGAGLRSFGGTRLGLAAALLVCMVLLGSCGHESSACEAEQYGCLPECGSDIVNERPHARVQGLRLGASSAFTTSTSSSSRLPAASGRRTRGHSGR